jgi:hypothetical protein
MARDLGIRKKTMGIEVHLSFERESHECSSAPIVIKMGRLDGGDYGADLAARFPELLCSCSFQHGTQLDIFPVQGAIGGGSGDCGPVHASAVRADIFAGA